MAYEHNNRESRIVPHSDPAAATFMQRVIMTGNPNGIASILRDMEHPDVPRYEAVVLDAARAKALEQVEPTLRDLTDKLFGEMVGRPPETKP